MRIEEVESTHSLVQDNHQAGRVAVAAGGDPEGVEAVVAACVVEDRVVDLVEGEGAQDPAHLGFPPLCLRISCLDRDRLPEELVETNPHFEEDRRCLGREGSHLWTQARGGVVISLHRICKMLISSLDHRIEGSYFCFKARCVCSIE
jgi:hypothetical protein